MGQLHVKVLPSCSTHCPPCRQGALSQRVRAIWQYFPEKPGGHKHLDPDIWSYMGQREQQLHKAERERERERERMIKSSSQVSSCVRILQYKIEENE